MEDIRVTLDKEKKERNDVKLLQLEVFKTKYKLVKSII